MCIKASVYFNLLRDTLGDKAASSGIINLYKDYGCTKYLAPRPQKFESENTQQSHEFWVSLNTYSRPMMIGLLQSAVDYNIQDVWFPKVIEQVSNFDEVEVDSDNDGCNDVIEAGFVDANNDGVVGDDSPTNVNTTGVLYFWRKRNDQTQPSYATLTKIGYTANSAPGGGTANTFNYFNTLNNAANTWVINVGQGFFVQATAAANLVFTNAMRRGVNNSNQFFRTVNKTTSDVSLYKLNLSSSNGFFSQMLVGYSSDYTLGVDRGIDGSNINSEEYMCSSIDGVAYTIQGRPEFTPTDIVPLQYKIATADEYTITIEQFDGLFGTQDVYIKDKLTNFTHNLKTGPYTFGSESGLFTDRFEVVYESPLSTNDPHFNPNSVVVYKQNQDVVINTGTVQMSNVKIYHIRGRLLASKSNINASQVKLYAGTTNQVLIVKITSDTNGVITKKVIN